MSDDSSAAEPDGALAVEAPTAAAPPAALGMAAAVGAVRLAYRQSLMSPY